MWVEDARVEDVRVLRISSGEKRTEYTMIGLSGEMRRTTVLGFVFACHLLC